MIEMLIAYIPRHKLVFIGLGMIIIGIIKIWRRKTAVEKELEYWKSRTLWNDRGFSFFFPNPMPSDILGLRFFNGFILILAGTCFIVYYLSE
ncbi:MAG: hypothetical protein ACM3UZ_03785 [Acidobacteriota bacterium]